eukprot:m.53913 g.53913  ORF g.53913 m.53913 type:complete len:116 (+) comp7691_c3_seq1:116-463(+)
MNKRPSIHEKVKKKNVILSNTKTEMIDESSNKEKKGGGDYWKPSKKWSKSKRVVTPIHIVTIVVSRQHATKTTQSPSPLNILFYVILLCLHYFFEITTDATAAVSTAVNAATAAS